MRGNVITMRLSVFLVIASYVILIGVVFAPILWVPQNMLVFGDDIHRSYHFFRQLFGDSLWRGEFPWWNPYLFSGEPLIANPSVAFWYPVNWLFAVFPYRYVFSWTIPLHIFWAMLGMYTLLRRVISNFQFPISNEKSNISILRPTSYVLHPTVGAWIGGLVFGLSGYFMGRVWEGHIELITAASWMPWVIAAFAAISNFQFPISNDETTIQKYKQRRAIVLAGAALAMQLLAGYQTMALFTLEAVFIMTLVHCLVTKRFQPLLRMGLAVIIGIGLAAIQILPSQEFFARSIRTYDLPYSWAVFGSYTKENLKQLIDPFVLGYPWAYRGPSPNFGEMAAYMGKATLVLSAIGLVFAIRQGLWMGIAMAIIALFGLWVSLGWNAPFDLNKLLWDIVPTYRYLRIPSRHLILLVFGASALVAYSLSFARHRLAKLVIAFVIVIDLVWFARRFVTLKPDPATRHNKELVAYLQKNSGLTRVLPNFNVGMGTRDALDFDAAMSYRLFSASGYDPAILRNYYEFAAAVAGIEHPDVQTSDVQIPYLLPASRYVDFLNVKYVFVPSWFDSVAGSSPKYKLVMEENTKDYFRLYENTQVLPRFFLVPTMVGMPSRDAIASAIRAGEYDPTETVLVQQKDFPSGFAADCGTKELPTVAVVSYSTNNIVLTAAAPCNAFLVTSEVMYPGWRATIDGKPARIIEGNLAFRTLPVSSGFHTVTLTYRPRTVFIGFLISIGAAFVCAYYSIRNARALSIE